MTIENDNENIDTQTSMTINPVMRLMHRRRLLILLIIFNLSPLCSADSFPDRPLTMVVAFGPGGSTDRMARAMSAHMAQALGQPIQVINRKGAGTLLGNNYLLDQPDDGYTILASSFSPYLANTILSGTADYEIDDFAYINLQWFDEDLIAVNRDSDYRSLPQLLDAIRNHPKTVRGAVVRGSGGHLIARLLLEKCGIPQDNLNLVTYNGGGPPRAAVAGHVVDFIIISAQGSESIREYLKPLAIVSRQKNPKWDAPVLTDAMAETGCDMPVLPGTIRGYAISAESRRTYPARFDKLVAATKAALENEELIRILDSSSIGRRWTGPAESAGTMTETSEIFRDYSYLLEPR